jgi:putative hemolysin
VRRLLAITLIVAALGIAACGGTAVPAPTSAPTATEAAPTATPTQMPATEVPTGTTLESPLDLPNPASQHCEDLGYKLEIRDEGGGQVGYCIFPDGSECEEWAFYRGDCRPADTTFDSPLGLPNPASQHCVDLGYKLEIRDEAGGQVGYCVFTDGTECEEWAFYRGECGPGTPKP